MNKIIFGLMCFFLSTHAFSQISINPVSNFIIGLPKATQIELDLIKKDFQNEDRIGYANFFFKDYVLLIEIDPKSTLSYSDIESTLAKYFNKSDIYNKEIISYKMTKAGYFKDDKYIIK